MTTTDQAALFAPDDPPRPVASGVPATPTDPARNDAALTGDGYRWLTATLPAPTAPACEHCSRPMVLPTTAPVLWACPVCHPEEAR
jgi:hypothetical protein